MTEVPIWVDMVEGRDGIWEYTTESLAPELYSYMFRIDGLPYADPSNQYRHRDMTTAGRNILYCIFATVPVVTRTPGLTLAVQPRFLTI